MLSLLFHLVVCIPVSEPPHLHLRCNLVMNTGSQVMLYFVGGSLSYIVEDLGATTNGSWLPVANTLAITAVAPFVGKFVLPKVLLGHHLLGFHRISPRSRWPTSNHSGRIHHYHGRRLSDWCRPQFRHGTSSKAPSPDFWANQSQAVAGMAISGTGAAVCELTALAGIFLPQLLFCGCGSGTDERSQASATLSQSTEEA